MGVIYKLKQEVIDVIVQTKVDNPTISCRQLAEDVSNRFDIKVSKSSINTILKNAELSSSVGRRSNVEVPKKFKIPDERKKVLKQKVEQAGLIKEMENFQKPEIIEKQEEIKGALSILEIASEKEKKEAAPKTNAVGGVVQKKVLSGDNNADDREKVDSDIREQLKRIKNRKSSNFSASSKAMGSIFLTAIDWDIAEKCLISTILEGISGGTLSNEDDLACRIWFHFWAAGFKSPEELGQNKGHGIWELYIEKERTDEYLVRIKKICKMLAENNLDKNLCFDIVHDIEESFHLVRGITVNFEKRGPFRLNGSLTGFEDRGAFCSRIYIDKALRCMSRYLISNLDPIYFRNISFNNNNLGEIIDLAAFLNDSHNFQFKDISVVNQKYEPLCTYTVCPPMKRSFLIKLDSEIELFKKMAVNNKWAVKKHIVDPLSERAFYFDEVVLNASDPLNALKGTEVRVITMTEIFNETQPVAILTNDMTLDAARIIKICLFRRLFLDKNEKNAGKPLNCYENEGSIEKNSSISFDESDMIVNFCDKSGYVGLIDWYLGILMDKCLGEYFSGILDEDSLKCLMSDIYGIYGRAQQFEDNILIELDKSKASLSDEILNHLAFETNVREITNEKGQKLFITFSK